MSQLPLTRTEKYRRAPASPAPPSRGLCPGGWRLAGALLLGLTSLPACSDQPAGRENSELRADPSAADAAATSTPALDDDRLATAPLAAPVAGALAGVGRRYRVAVGMAYFFDAPAQATPNGRYLRRGDTFYGEGETNGFVKTSFVQPNGAAGTAWLKRQELSQLGGAAAATAAPPRPAAPPAEYNYETDEPVRAAGAPAAASGAPATAGGGRAVVQVARSYFYPSPDLATARKAFCQRGDKVQVLETRGEAVYVTFTNWEKVTTTGWMRRSALR